MVLKSVIPAETILAYTETDFVVHDEQVLILRIDEYNAELNKLYKVYNTRTCTFVTAYNPYSQVLKESVNIARNKGLAAELDDKALKYLPAEGIHHSGDWPIEASYLVLGLSLEESCELGKKYEQNAIVWCDSDCLPKLILLR